MTLYLLLGSVLGVVTTAFTYERLVRALRLELNQARTNEQLLLTRLASRTPAEYHAVVAPAAVDKDREAVYRYLRDPTGLQVMAVPDDEGET